MKVDIVYEKEMLYLYVLSSIAGLLLLLLIFPVPDPRYVGEPFSFLPLGTQSWPSQCLME